MIYWAMRIFMICVAIGLVAVFSYSQSRVASGPEDAASEVNSTRTARSERKAVGQRSMTIKAGRDGHYRLDARVNGTTVRFMVDTGATSIVLRREDAKRVGLHVREHHFTGRAQTANGVVTWAPVVLRDLRIGSLTVRNIEGVVNGGRLSQSLLGMEFLRHLDRYEVADGTLILYW